VSHFAEWLSTTALSVFLQVHNAWAVPVIQSIHIVGITIIMGSVFMVMLRILGWAGTDQTLMQTTRRFGPWFTGAMCLQLVTGILMVIAEPMRELVNFSFWLKMLLVAVGVTLPQHEEQWEKTLINRRSIKSLAVLAFVIWICVILLGRFIAYDHIWGAWSPATKA
jgi:hypothetical protein